MSKPFKQELIAPCGMNCGICVAYLRDKRKCLGCRLRDKKCGIRNCEKFQKNKFKYCHECDTFPCARIKRLDKRYRTKYEMSMIENLEYIRENGVGKFIEGEITRWKCPKCGGVICVHNRKCYTCGTQGIPKTGKSAGDDI